VVWNYTWLKAQYRYLIDVREEFEVDIEEPDLQKECPGAYGRALRFVAERPVETESMGIALANANVFSVGDFIRMEFLYEEIRYHSFMQQRLLVPAEEILEKSFITTEDADQLLVIFDGLIGKPWGLEE
jgi:hypothetical protein